MKVIRYAVALMYTSFTTTIVSERGFSGDAKWVTGKPGDELVLSFEPIE